MGTYTGFPEIAGETVLYIATTGGPDGGPTLALDEGLTLEPTRLRVEDGVLKLLDQRCDLGNGGESADTSYGWRLDGSTLTLMLITNLCSGRDQMIEILLGGMGEDERDHAVDNSSWSLWARTQPLGGGGCASRRWVASLAPRLPVESVHGSRVLIEPATLRAEVGVFTLGSQECRESEGRTRVDASYRWRLDGSTLTITPISSGCRASVRANDILTREWNKTSETTSP